MTFRVLGALETKHAAIFATKAAIDFANNELRGHVADLITALRAVADKPSEGTRTIYALGLLAMAFDRVGETAAADWARARSTQIRPSRFDLDPVEEMLWKLLRRGDLNAFTN